MAEKRDVGTRRVLEKEHSRMEREGEQQGVEVSAAEEVMGASSERQTLRRRGIE